MARLCDRKNKISIVREYTNNDTTWYLLENDGRACFSRDKTTDPATLPYIEYTDPLLQHLYHCVITSDNDMWFVDTNPWNDYGIIQEEFENRIDAMIDKYSLEDVITKNEDDALYTFYGDLQRTKKNFTEEMQKEDHEKVAALIAKAGELAKAKKPIIKFEDK